MIGNRRLGHIVDPRSGQPIDGPITAAVVARAATDADGLSTALLVLGEAGLSRLAEFDRGLSALVAYGSDRGGEARIGSLNWPADDEPRHSRVSR